MSTGFAGWQDLTAEVSTRLGRGLAWAAAQARRAIHDNDVERLKHLVAEYPALLSWHDDEYRGGLLEFATGAYGDAFGAEREGWFTRAAAAELLIDAGAVVMPSIPEGLIDSRAAGLLQLFQRKGLLPRTLNFCAALGDVDAVRTALDENRDRTTVNEAFLVACRFERHAVASLLLDRSIALDPELGVHIDRSFGRPAFIMYFSDWGRDFDLARAGGLWRAMMMAQVKRWVRDGYVEAFVGGLQREPWLLDEDCVWFQVELIADATLNGHGELLEALLARDPAVLRRQPPPPSQAIEIAFTYAHTDLLPLLTRIWPVPDDLPHAAGMGDLARVTRWFDAEGQPALGEVANHAPANSVHPREPQWGEVGVQQVLDTALAWSVINHHFDVADFLLGHGADINTNWNSHEPASILHHLVFLEGSGESMQFLIDRGIDMTIKDYRWNSTAQGWARYGKSDEPLAQWLENAEEVRT